MIFNSLTPELIQRRHRVHDTCRQFNRSPSKGNLLRLKSLFARYGEDVFIEQGFYCDYGDKITLGQRVYININCTILDGGEVTIGNDCLIGPNVQILTINHDTSATDRLNKNNYAEDIHIESNVWIGAGTIILPGINIGSNAVIGAGSVVTKNIQANCLYAGNPAKKIRQLDETEST
ncbi:MAG: sugar O-acetyltransferase [gamma proteobacterium symbiont of Bathyaustriella thionipta]|nr:sugar O-acetyltransferase [gamma proteobacterium symbiont of Bathyaustriella thionipta]MCU7950833.1 sugar O-acetyltransferase [gamma proteobacterium symbiont of Bathyaustriella thionipta]MCU7951909.1 sugar O-acetyltransferase [gamma proteobacterium symbiont of Bathyaustriella thionipta]MCU7957347.1 sugar O-acetyltransferase [gamma proteobacterium symbiont of Bathyaustriella thionipta]MCU7966656.1 sugar O-acetyltransferase [gamma proteobacterium symbiont of Bathyaustriella thionipta]